MSLCDSCYSEGWETGPGLKRFDGGSGSGTAPGLSLGADPARKDAGSCGVVSPGLVLPAEPAGSVWTIPPGINPGSAGRAPADGGFARTGAKVVSGTGRSNATGAGGTG